MQVIENLTIVTGRIVSRRPHPTLEPYDLVVLHIDGATPVEGKADLLSQFVGTELPVTVRRELLGDAQPGWTLRCRAKRIPDGAMAEPHPDEGEFATRPAGGPGSRRRGPGPS